MNKSEFVKAISEKAEMTIKDSEKFLNTFIDVTTESLKKGDEIALVGFGSFSVVKRSARMGMNFRTKKAVKIPASKGIKFKCGKTLKEAVNV